MINIILKGNRVYKVESTSDMDVHIRYFSACLDTDELIESIDDFEVIKISKKKKEVTVDGEYSE